MYRNRFVAIFLVLTLATMACSIDINLPITQLETGPEQTDQILIEAPESTGETIDLFLEFGAGELNLEGGAGDSLLEGEAVYNVPDFEPTVDAEGPRVGVRQGNLEIEGIPKFEDDVTNVWNFLLGDAPMNLEIDAGAYRGNFDFGGLSLLSLEISDGASDVDLEFSSPNQVEMDEFTYRTGASDVRLTGLANANFEDMTFRSGAGNYILDFSGELQRDARVRIESGISTVRINVPDGVSAVLEFDGGLTNIDPGKGWVRDGNAYTHAGEGPTISIEVTMGAGSLELN